MYQLRKKSQRELNLFDFSSNNIIIITWSYQGEFMVNAQVLPVNVTLWSKRVPSTRTLRLTLNYS